MLDRVAEVLYQGRRPGAGELSGDTIAGTVTAVLVVPQAMAYAMLAGLPPGTGLYAAILPALVYAFFGTSRCLAVGPTSIVAAMTAAAIAVSELPGDPVANAVVLAGLAGLMLLGMGALRLGVLSSLLSHPVLKGFTSGAAIVIAMDQSRHLFGIDLPGGLSPHETLALTAVSWQDMDPREITLGGFSILLLVLAARPLPRMLRSRLGPDMSRLPGRFAPLALVLLGALAAGLPWMHGVALVGEIDVAPPALSIDLPAPATWVALIPSAALVAVIIYVESVTIAKHMANLRRERVHPSREMLALGAANLASAASGAMPVAGSFSRSLVNMKSGARSQFAGIVTAALTAITLVLLAPAFELIPRAVLAAVIIVAVISLLDLRSIARTWRFSRADASTNAVTFLGVIVYGIEAGLVAGVILSLVLYIWRTGRPHVTVVGRRPGSESFRSVRRHSVETWPHLLMVRIDENLYFANVGYVTATISGEISRRPKVRHLVLIMSGVGFIDSSALESLEMAAENLRDVGVTLHLAGVKGPVLERLRRTSFIRQLAPGRIYDSVSDAERELSRAAGEDKVIIPI